MTLPARGFQSQLPKAGEDAAGETVLSFARGLRDWWDKYHVDICNKAFNAALFLGAVGICKLCGADGDLAVVISGVVTQGDEVIDALKAAADKKGK